MESHNKLYMPYYVRDKDQIIFHQGGRANSCFFHLYKAKFRKLLPTLVHVRNFFDGPIVRVRIESYPETNAVLLMYICGEVLHGSHRSP